MPETTTIGSRLRHARKSAGMSLADVAGEALMSISTLSRIETDKQPVEVETLISLASITGVDPAALVATSSNGGDSIDPLLERLRLLNRDERTRLWQHLATISRDTSVSTRARAAEMRAEVDELLAQLDFIRAEIETVRNRIR